MIEIKSLTKSFKRVVLNNINLKLEYGNIYLLKGISGSGKTTLLNIIAGLDTGYDGSCVIDGKDIKEMSKKELYNYRIKVGMMFQKSFLYKSLSILDNLLFINSDLAKIIKYSKLFGIEHILKKYPNEISGGERQRVALIRALLHNNIIILDEPTSSLDFNNSNIFVKYLSKIDLTNKIIIIASHKDIYDDIANAIIHISLGNVTVNRKKINHSNKVINNEVTYERKNLLKIFNNAHKNSIVFNCFISLLLISLMLAISFKIKFREEYLNTMVSEYTFNVIDLNLDSALEIENLVDKKYYNYSLDFDEYKVYPLLDYEDSAFKADGAIYIGKFPQNNDEIIVNREFVISYYNYDDNNIKDALNKKIEINEKDYIIVGIVGSKDFDYSILYSTNIFYSIIASQLEIKPAIFMMYEEIKNIGQTIDDKVIVRINSDKVFDLYDGKIEKLNDDLIMSVAFSNWENRVKSISTNVSSLSILSIISVVVLFILTMFFLINQISMELFFRKREIGYLQVFHFSKDDITFAIIIQYIKPFFKCLVFSILIYYLILLFIYVFIEYNLLINFIYVLIIILVFILYIYLIIVISLHRYLKADIIDLIKD